jgi:hypothetical protein
LGHIDFLIASDGAKMITTKEDLLIQAMIKAIVSPSDTESEEARQLTLEIARNMKMSEVQECQLMALKLIKQKQELDQIVDRALNKDKIH